MSDKVRVVSGDAERPEPYPWTTIRQWVAASGVSSKAAHIYTLLCFSVYSSGKPDIADLTLDDLAGYIEVSRGDRVTRYIKELEAIGAIKVIRPGRGEVNIFKVYQRPPKGYNGPTSLHQSTKIRRTIKGALDEAPPAETPSSGDEGADEAGNPEPRSTGDQGLPVETPSTGDGPEDATEPRSAGSPEPTSTGEALIGTEVLGSEGSLNPPSPQEDPQPAAAAVAEAVPGGEDQQSEGQSTADAGSAGLRAAVAYIREIRPSWKAYAVQKALVDAVNAGRRPDHAVAALVALARDLTGSTYGGTDAPGRLNALDGQWWVDAEPKAPAAPPQPRGPRCLRHPDHLAGSCRLCAAEAPAAPLDVDPIAAARAKVAEAAAAARAARRAAERPALDWLREETGELPEYRPDPEAAAAIDERAE